MDQRQKLKILREKSRREALKKQEENFELFARDEIKIITKDPSKGFVPFKFNASQKIIDRALEKQREETGKVRAVILKARQQGISTYCSARVFWKTFFVPNTRSVVMAHDSATSDALFDMSKNIIDRMGESKPETYRSNAKEIKFAHNNSGYRLYTAGAKEAGRGTTPTIAHLSEIAFWNFDKEILAGLFQGISQADGTEVILESTANGASGEFFRLFRDAEEGNNEYIAIFIPWFATEEYVRSLPKGFELTVDEEDYKENYDLTDEQLYWRRLKIAESGEDKFRQEYPATAEEAFLVSGSSVFNQEQVGKLIPVTPKSVRNFDDTTGFFEESRRGPLEVWQVPGFDSKFIIGADVALGVGQDYSTAVVLDVEGNVCATYRDNTIDPSNFGDILFYLGRYYNNALMAVESNSMGIATITRLQQMGYVNLYYQTKRMTAMNDEAGLKPGFRMTTGTKPMVIGYLKRAIDEDDIWIPSKNLIDELKVYVSNDNGQTGALPGHHDDLIMALGIAWEARRTHLDKLTNDRISWRDRHFVKEKEEVWL
jgi:hypothetical protein